MMNVRIPALLALACALTIGGTMQARAAETDCSSAALQSMLQHDQTMMSGMKMSDDVEHDAMMMMAAHEQSLANLAKFEMTCGKNEKAKAAAKRTYDTVTAQQKELQLLLGGP